MTDIELRKAELLAAINSKKGWDAVATEYHLLQIIRELCEPSTQSPDNEVEEAIEDFCRTWLHCGMEEAKTLHAKWWAKLQAVKEDNAAQQPLKCSKCSRSYDQSRHMSCPECFIDELTAENKRLKAQQPRQEWMKKDE